VLQGIQSALEAQSARLVRLHEREPIILRHTEIRRGIGLTALHERPGGHSRRRPLGTSGAVRVDFIRRYTSAVVN
jgi:hypothetical protein